MSRSSPRGLDDLDVDAWLCVFEGAAVRRPPPPQRVASVFLGDPARRRKQGHISLTSAWCTFPHDHS
jgi:hypothetical protein